MCVFDKWRLVSLFLMCEDLKGAGVLPSKEDVVMVEVVVEEEVEICEI